MKIDILTIFPNMFAGALDSSILSRAQENGILDIKAHDIRTYSNDKHKKTDAYPFGGGAGMLMSTQPIFEAISDIGQKKRMIYMSPRGKILDESMITDLSNEESLLILCGHYEGVDQRILDYYDFEEVSIGDYILTGGEIPAMVLIDSVARLLPDVLGNENAHDEESIYSGLLEYPQYTRPSSFQTPEGEVLEVPDVLLSGNHKEIRLWNFRKSLELTAERRPDLFSKYVNKYLGIELGLELGIGTKIESGATPQSDSTEGIPKEKEEALLKDEKKILEQVLKELCPKG